MCFVLEDGTSSSLANSLHRLETMCKDIVQILRDQENSIGTKEEVVDANSKEAAMHLQYSIPMVVNQRGMEEGEAIGSLTRSVRVAPDW
jgi:t-SNARE complex subunit (syntaxin)